MLLRVLILDDSPETAETLRMLYAAMPEVEVVGTVGRASEAWKALEAGGVDMVSVDIQLENENGLDFSARVRERFPHVHIAICSVEDNEWMRSKARKAGAHFYLPKPVSLDHVEELIQALVGRENAGAVHSASEREVEDWFREILGNGHGNA
jgi:DNA-binding NarL/FixJ family response regulator